MVDHCKHFPPMGIGASTCKAGMVMREMRGDNPTGVPFRVTWPCMKEGQHLPCAHRVMPTPEEVAAEAADTERMLLAFWRGECPRCGQKLVKTELRAGGGYVARCPSCPDVSERACSPRDVGGGRRGKR